MDITLGSRNELTGRYNFVLDETTNDISFDDTEAHAVVTSIIEAEGSWWADRRHGSKLRTLRNLTSRTPSQATAIALEALAPLEAANAIAGVRGTAPAVRAQGQLTGRLEEHTEWTTPTGEKRTERIGV